MPPDELLAKQKSEHGLPGQYNGLDDVLQHKAIIESKISTETAMERAARIPGVKITREGDRLTATPSDLRSSLALAHITDDTRDLKRKRSNVIKVRDAEVERIEVKGQHGRQARIAAHNEHDLGRRDVIQHPRGAVTFTHGLPRCGGRNASDAVHEMVNGRCLYCGKAA